MNFLARGLAVMPAIALGAALTACGGHGNSSPDTGSAKAVAAMASLTAAEIQYGVSPTRNSQVTYQDDVVIMEHGAEAIRAQSANGLAWTIDASAPGAQSIQTDTILFATGRVVGRVLAVERRGGDLVVTLGPVELTEVIKDAQITYHGALDLDRMITYMAPDAPGTFTDRDAEEQARATQPARRDVRLALWTPDDRSPFRVMPAAYLATETDASGTVGGVGGVPADIPIGGFHFAPDVRKGLGFSATHTEKGMQFTAYAKLHLDNPNFTFRLDIANSRLKTAEVELSGVGGVQVGFKGGTNGEFKNPNQSFELPLDISFPIPGIPVPFAATFHQSILVQTMFTAKAATLNAFGDYGFGGTITAGVINGNLGATAPVFIQTRQNLANSLDGVSLGVNGIVLGYGGKFIVGLGAFSFAVGPYLSANTTVGVTRGSDLQTGVVGYTCRSAQYDMSLEYGVGYAIPNTVVKALNTFLSLFHARTIDAVHGTKLGTVPIKTNSEAVPPGCEAKPSQ